MGKLVRKRSKKTGVLSTALRQAVRESGLHIHVLAEKSGIQYVSLYRFMKHGCSLRLDVADKLAAYFKLKVCS